MRRFLLALGFVLPGVVVVWAGAALPPPLLLLRYGGPGAQGPTGRVARVDEIEFVEISAGYVRMGSDRTGKRADAAGRVCHPLGIPRGRPMEVSEEMPAHWVELPRPFWIARRELTNGDYARLDPKHKRLDAAGTVARRPVDYVSWTEARSYCAWLAGRSGLPVRLPTEAEWECAARAGTRTRFAHGDSAADIAGHAWFAVNSDGSAHAVATTLPNPWGLYDLAGNQAEWCEDVYRAPYREPPPLPPGIVAAPPPTPWPFFARPRPPGGPSPPARVVRGGSFQSPSEDCRPAARGSRKPDGFAVDLGFRPAFSLSEDRDSLVEPWLVDPAAASE